MEPIDHILTALAVLCAAAAAWFARRAKPSKQQEGAQLAATAVDYADAHPSPGISRERTAPMPTGLRSPRRQARFLRRAGARFHPCRNREALEVTHAEDARTVELVRAPPRRRGASSSARPIWRR